MGRLWLALVLLAALVAPALATAPHVPATPRIARAHLELGDQRTSAGLYDVSQLWLDAELDPYAIMVRITVHAANGDESTVETTPDHLVLVYPHLLAPVGASKLFVTAIGTSGIESERAEITVVAQRHHRADAAPALLFIVAMVFGVIMGVLLMLGVLFKMRATEVRRARLRADTEPTALANPAAEDYIRRVAMRALLALSLVIAVVVVPLGAGIVSIPIYGSPLLLVVAVHALLRVINAGRAIALLHRPGAAAQTRHDQLEVTAAQRRVTLRSSPALVERARRDALPRATL